MHNLVPAIADEADKYGDNTLHWVVEVHSGRQASFLDSSVHRVKFGIIIEELNTEETDDQHDD